LRALYKQNNAYEYDGVTILCDETHKSKPEYVKFTLQFPMEMLALENCDKYLYIATADYCLREFVRCIEKIDLEREHKTGKEKYTGKIYIHKPNQKILLRNSSFIQDNKLNIMFVIRFPVHMMEKRNVVAGKLSVKIIKKELAKAIRDFVASFDRTQYVQFVSVYRRQQEVRRILKEKGLVCFIANNSVLPRINGDLPLPSAVPFMSPREDEIELVLSDGYTLKGMGICEGVTVITGGGYSGKSTLLDSILSGVYNHISGDGREYCITEHSSCKIIAEDGRSVTSLNISQFIRNVTYFDTERFTSLHASGSTSQAANIIEAISFGCKTLLIDEDRTATNFMIRDSRMKQIIKDDPIVPFTDRVRQLYQEVKVSTILIIGGTSEYLDLADNVYMMNDYRLYNYNDKIALFRQNAYEYYYINDKDTVRWRQDRIVKSDTLTSFRKDTESNRIHEYINIDKFNVQVGSNMVDVSRLDTLISQQQVTTIAFVIRKLANMKKDPTFNLYKAVVEIYEMVSKEGLDSIYSNSFDVEPDLELPTLHDILFAFSRMSLPEYL
jgi:predicted ABC-class ATPase